MSVLFRLLLFILALLGVLLIVVVVNTLRMPAVQPHNEAIAAPAVTAEALAHFQQAIRYKTISHADPARFDSAEFVGFRKFIEGTYPEFHRAATRHRLAGHSLLYEWPGQDQAAQPVVLMAHQDVVPIEEKTRAMWTVDPFEGTVKDGYIWGRGTTDDKINLISILEAAEKLARDGFRPERTVYVVFGHDEEIGGNGAIAIAAWMKERNIQASWVMDEGGFITKDKVPGVAQPVALLGTAEKGYLSVELTVEKPGGHSSMPEPETAIDILTRAIVALRQRPFDARLTEPVAGMLEAVGPLMPFVQRMAFANPWLFESLIIKTFGKSGSGNAIVRTTFVPTIIEGGIKDNIVPTVAKATANLRLLPGDEAQAVVARLKEIVADDRVQITATGPLSEASPVSSAQGFGFQKIAAAIRKTYPHVTPSPFLMIGATDSRHFTGVSANIIKFSPMIDPIGFHGIDERVSLESYQTALWFYEQLLRDLK